MDYILNGAATGDVAERLMAVNMDVGALRPWIGKDGRSYMTINQGGVLKNVPLMNTTATLRKDDWAAIDASAIKAAEERLKLVKIIRGRGLEYGIPNGMGRTVLETETMGDVNDAELSMDGLRQGANDRPTFELSNLPLPIAHYDWSFSARQIMASRNGGSPLDTTMSERAGRKVSEKVEKLFTGALSTYTFGGGTLYGMTNFATRQTYAMTSPADSTWTGALFITQILAMRQLAYNAHYYGPFMLFNSPAWDSYLDRDYSASKGDNTVRDRVLKISGIEGMETLDFMSNYDMVLCQMTSDVVRAVVGMDIVTVQWDSHGGLQKNFKTMAIIVPQFRSDQESQCGIVHGSAT
jgi:hypothetical protein